jgi:TetR/AcrR family transcriptional regulator, ethionamide resistance regulator
MSVPKAKATRSKSGGKKRSPRHSSEEARREIMNAAVRFFWLHTFRDLTIGRLMEETPLSRSAFYQYFRDLHELVEHLLLEVAEVMRQTAHPWISGEGEPIAALRSSLRGVVQTAYDHGPVFRAISEAAPLDERVEKTWSAFMKGWDDLVEARIKAQQKAGLISHSLDAQRIANALNALDASVLITHFGRRPQGDPEAVLETLHHIWVATLYGHQPKNS